MLLFSKIISNKSNLLYHGYNQLQFPKFCIYIKSNVITLQQYFLILKVFLIFLPIYWQLANELKIFRRILQKITNLNIQIKEGKISKNINLLLKNYKTSFIINLQEKHEHKIMLALSYMWLKFLYCIIYYQSYESKQSSGIHISHLRTHPQQSTTIQNEISPQTISSRRKRKLEWVIFKRLNLSISFYGNRKPTAKLNAKKMITFSIIYFTQFLQYNSLITRIISQTLVNSRNQ